MCIQNVVWIKNDWSNKEVLVDVEDFREEKVNLYAWFRNQFIGFRRKL
jgi:hypothetical protein